MTSPTPPILPAGPLSGDNAPFVIDSPEADLLRALGDFLTAILRIEVTVGQANRVPQPKGPNYVIMTPVSRIILATTTHTTVVVDDVMHIDRQRAIRAEVQLDFYGPNSTDNGQVFSTLFRDDYAIEFMAGTGVVPLYCDDGHQMPLINGEYQFEQRWKVLASLQINPAVSTPQDFADTLHADLFEVA